MHINFINIIAVIHISLAMHISKKTKPCQLRYVCLLIIISPQPNGVEGNYTINITIDGKTFAELGGTRCNGCYFNVSPHA